MVIAEFSEMDHITTGHNVSCRNLCDTVRHKKTLPPTVLYVHNSMVEFSGASEDVSFMQFSQKIDGFRQKDSQGF